MRQPEVSIIPKRELKSVLITPRVEYKLTQTTSTSKPEVRLDIEARVPLVVIATMDDFDQVDRLESEADVLAIEKGRIYGWVCRNEIEITFGPWEVPCYDLVFNGLNGEESVSRLGADPREAYNLFKDMASKNIAKYVSTVYRRMGFDLRPHWIVWEMRYRPKHLSNEDD